MLPFIEWSLPMQGLHEMESFWRSSEPTIPWQTRRAWRKFASRKIDWNIGSQWVHNLRIAWHGFWANLGFCRPRRIITIHKRWNPKKRKERKSKKSSRAGWKYGYNAFKINYIHYTIRIGDDMYIDPSCFQNSELGFLCLSIENQKVGYDDSKWNPIILLFVPLNSTK